MHVGMYNLYITKMLIARQRYWQKSAKWKTYCLSAQYCRLCHQSDIPLTLIHNLLSGLHHRDGIHLILLGRRRSTIRHALQETRDDGVQTSSSPHKVSWITSLSLSSSSSVGRREKDGVVTFHTELFQYCCKCDLQSNKELLSPAGLSSTPPASLYDLSHVLLGKTDIYKHIQLQ